MHCSRTSTCNYSRAQSIQTNIIAFSSINNYLSMYEVWSCPAIVSQNSLLRCSSPVHLRWRAREEAWWRTCTDLPQTAEPHGHAVPFEESHNFEQGPPPLVWSCRWQEQAVAVHWVAQLGWLGKVLVFYSKHLRLLWWGQRLMFRQRLSPRGLNLDLDCYFAIMIWKIEK